MFYSRLLTSLTLFCFLIFEPLLPQLAVAKASVNDQDIAIQPINWAEEHPHGLAVEEWQRVLTQMGKTKFDLIRDSANISIWFSNQIQGRQSRPTRQLAKLTATDEEMDDYFGISTSLSGNRLAVGSLGDDNQKGAVYLFERNSGGADAWGQVAKLTAADGLTGDRFGIAVSLDGDRLAIGAPEDNNGQGSVYLFERDNLGSGEWLQAAKITANDKEDWNGFGLALSLSGDRLAVGAWGNNQHRGAVYVFERDNGEVNSWDQVAKLTAADGEEGDSLGAAVSLSGDQLAIGAYGDDAGRGSAYLFERDSGGTGSWVLMVKLTANDRDVAGAVNAFFGYAISLNSDRLAIGAPGYDYFPGAVYLFERNNGGVDSWGQIKKLTVADGAEGHRFGNAVSLNGDRLAVGSEGNYLFQGAAYLFEHTSDSSDAWSQVAKLKAANSEDWNKFGSSISLSSDTLAVGDINDDDKGTASGAAYIYIPWTAQVYLPLLRR